MYTFSAFFRIPSIAVASIAMLMFSHSAQAEENTRYIVHYKDGSHRQVRQAIVSARANIHYQIQRMNAVSIEASGAGLRQLLQNPEVASVEVDVKRYPFATSTPATGKPYQVGQLVPYGISLVQADKLPNGDLATSNRKVCIIDSGIDREHEDLSGNEMSGEYDYGTGWWYTDENRHGTHVAGTIAAINNSGVGVVGVNPGKRLKLHIVKVFGANGWAYSSSLVTAANKCRAAGANIITMSLGGPSYSKAEDNGFNELSKAGILIFAASGNAGNASLSYPAGYASVVSVGAVNESKQWASFSQYNSKVELTAPGVAVLSTIPMGTGSETSLMAIGKNFNVSRMEGSPSKAVSAPLADFGLGMAVNRNLAGKVCLIQRGTIDFASKARNCQESGGLAAVIYNNAAGNFNGTLGGSGLGIPVISVSNIDGAALKAKQGQVATVKVGVSNYAYFDGTSMATPHAAAVAALVWSYFPTCTAAQMRLSLNNSALDLGTKGRDVKFGFGLIQAKTAYDRIKAKGCGK